MRDTMPPPLPTPEHPGGIAPARLRVCAAARTSSCPAAAHRAQHAQRRQDSGTGPARRHQHRYQLNGSTGGGISWNTGTAAMRLQTHILRIEYLCYHYAIISALFRAITLCFKQNESFVYNPNILQT